jgi:hypothetical protein
VGGLFVLAMIAANLFSDDPDPVTAPIAPLVSEAWTRDVRPRPAFSVVASDLLDKPASYEIFRHSTGGRKDVLCWGGADAPPAASFELYRSGREADRSRGGDRGEAALADLAVLKPGSVQPLGVLDTKFGSVRLLGALEAQNGRQCLGILKILSDPDLQLSGLFCPGDSAPVARAQVVCAVNRLTLLGAGSDPRLAEIFARADLRGRDCKNPSVSPVSGEDWVTAMDDPKLRGRL